MFRQGYVAVEIADVRLHPIVAGSAQSQLAAFWAKDSRLPLWGTAKQPLSVLNGHCKRIL